MSKGDPKEPTDLSPQGISQADYRARIAAAKGESNPVGGVNMPKMPRLDQPPPSQEVKNKDVAAQSALRAMSPDEYRKAVDEGRVMPGVGSAYVANQPSMQNPSSEEGDPSLLQVEGQGGKPVNPPREEGGLRPETIEGLQKLGEANTQEPENSSSAKEEDEPFEDWDFDLFGNRVRDILSNKKRKAAIEARCDPMELEDLIENQEVRQEVQIYPKKFVPVFRSMSADEHLFVKRQLAGDEGRNAAYIVDKHAVMQLCCSLFALNGKPLPNHLNDDGTTNQDKFYAKLKVLLRYPYQVTADLSANFVWFDERVKKLLVFEEFKNF